MKLQVLIVVISLATICKCQESIILDDSDESVQYMVNFVRTTPSGSFLSCSGVFIKENYILTGTDCVTRSAGSSFSFQSGISNVRLGDARQGHVPLKYHVHPVLNITVIEVETDDRSVSPRKFGKISTNRFCTMMGWEGYRTNFTGDIPLRMFSLTIANSTTCGNETHNAYCTRPSVAMRSNFTSCGGLVGAPIFCDNDDTVSGIVIDDQFCTRYAVVGGTFLSIDDIQDWINEVTGGAGTLSVTITLLISSLAFLV